MTTAARTEARDLVAVADPCAQPNPRLVVAAVRAGALGVLDLPGPAHLAETTTHLIASVTARTAAPFAVRLPADAAPMDASPEADRRPLLPDQLPDQVDTVILTGLLSAANADADGHAAADRIGAWGDRRVLVEVVSLHEAQLAVDAGAAGLIAKGCEGGGRIGEVEGFVLAQHIARLGVPFWSQGGIGLHTAAAAVAGGATGVVLDGQLALVRESSLDDEARRAVGAMDGSETRVVGGHRFYVRPGLPGADLPGDTPPAAVAARFGPDLHRDLLPLGQEAATAEALARRHRTVGGVVQAVREAIRQGLTAAAEDPPLAPGAGIARTHGTTYPLAQGPMTRVSDRPELAAAVAEAGGLPFLALALLPGREVEELLTRTAELLGDRPWGVGILGFVPADVRAAQLDVIHDLRPPVALIAGGRPSQAQPLEEAGIPTYLHVPSPGLLDRFLRDGARRFVFEGRECGGHVGPRASFPLWEAQVERLLAVDDPGELDVLFAGGVHDAHSAAMVSALAAPLARQGASIGVLMGTAYLFTHEAVSSRAITPTFQEMARSCDRTVLLETSPGHATRCLETDYAEAFSARKAELEGAGVPPKEMWAELEALNLGRLRVATKGLVRQGDELVELDEAAQRRDGMYMIGQAATLRRELTTVADLHREVSAGATAHLEAAAARHRRPLLEGHEPSPPVKPVEPVEPVEPVAVPVPVPVEPVPVEVAVVGMAAAFPGAADVEQFWANVLAGVDCVTEVPRQRWDPDTFHDPAAVTTGAGRRTPSRWGGFLPWIGFDPLAYGIPPRSLASIESVQLLSLEIARRALADAGYGERTFDRSRTAVIFGAEGGNDLSGAYGFRALHPHYLGDLPGPLDDHLPELTEDSFPGVLVNVIAGRIANRLDLGGANFTVDAACAASLAALESACHQLTSGASDLVLCGAADVHNGINDYLLFASAHALSPTGRCRTFDADADGIALGEGVACVVLKRLADAERDGDRIYAVVEAIAGSSDGRHLGLTAPNKQGQVRALERAYRQAGVAPDSIGLVEAHGTGTVVGDRTELATLTEVFTGAGGEGGAGDGGGDGDGRQGPQTIVLGSVKSQIGHTKCAAGLAGLIKAARALHAGVLPPTINIRRPNDYYDPETSPFRFLDHPVPWPASQRRAGLSAFGFGGTNFHTVLRSHPDDDRPVHGVGIWPAELLLLRADTAAAASERLADLHRIVGRVVADDPDGERHRLRDLARTVTESGRGPVQCAVVADDLADLATKLAAAAAGQPIDGVVWAGPARVPGGPAAAGTAGFGVGRGDGPTSNGPIGSTIGDTPAGDSPIGHTTDRDATGPIGGAVGGAGPVVAFLHPGQGSQRPGMLADLFVAFPGLQEVLRQGERWLDTLYPGAAYDPDDRAAQRAAVTDTRVAQPALGLGAVAVTRLLRSLGIEPHMVAGHSYGELAALWTSGVLDDGDLLALSEARGEAMAAAALGDDAGAMAAIRLAADELERRLPDDVVIANHNAPDQTVVAGPTTAVEALVAQLVRERIGATRLDVAAAFHSPLVAGATDELADVLGRVPMQPPRLPVWSNSTAAPYPTDPDDIRALLTAQLGRPVRFVEQVEAMYAAGARVFVEAGPDRVLTQLVDRILGDRPHVAVACDVPGQHGLRRLLLTLAELATAGVPLDPRPLFHDRAELLDLAALPAARPGWRLNGHLVCTHEGEPVAGGLQPADRIPQVIPEVTMDHGSHRQVSWPEPTPPVPAVSGPTGRDATVQEFLRAGQRIADGQREVLLRYLGDPAPTSPNGAGLLPPGTTGQLPTAAAPGAAGLLDPTTILPPSPASPMSPAAPAGPAGPIPPAGPASPMNLANPPHPTSPPHPAIPASPMNPANPANPVGPMSPASPASPAGPGPLGAELTGGDGWGGTNQAPAPDGAQPGDRTRVGGDELLSTVLGVVGERMGYPLDMLDPDLDLEADLSIDSIKRVEIIGELAERVELPGVDTTAGVDEAVVEELSQLKTLRGIVTWIEEHTQPEAPAAGSHSTASVTGVDAVGSPARAPVPGTPAAHPPVTMPAPGTPGTGTALTAPISGMPAAATVPMPGAPTAGTVSTTPAPGAPATGAPAASTASTTPAPGAPPTGAPAASTASTTPAPGAPATGAAPATQVPGAPPTGAAPATQVPGAPPTGTASTAEVPGHRGQPGFERTGGNVGGRGRGDGTNGRDDGVRAPVVRTGGAMAVGDEQASRPSIPATARRHRVELARLTPALPTASLEGQTFALVGDRWPGLGALRTRLVDAGATVEVLKAHRGTPGRPLPRKAASRLAQVDGVVHLGAAATRSPLDARDVFAALRPALTGRATTLVAAMAPPPPTDRAPIRVSGVGGLMRALAHELPDHHVRAVELPGGENLRDGDGDSTASSWPDVAGRLLADEVLDPSGPPWVTHRDGTRIGRHLGAGTPVTTDLAELPDLPLDRQSVVVVTGGARGITARAALGLARATGCRLELLGRSPHPGDEPEDPRTAAASDRPALRRALAQIGELRTPSEIETACNRTLAAREIRTTLAALEELDSPARYHQVDVRDAAAMAAALDGVRDRHGRIDAVIHGAGVLDDRLARDKTDEGFDRVFGTKVGGARNLLAGLGRDVRLVVLFGSVSGVYGNRGQVDYSAANDALDELALRCDGVDGRRFLSIDWGPWGGTGMVSAELEREYARRGIGLLDPDEAVRALLAELATPPGDPQVVVMRAEPQAMEPRPGPHWPSGASRPPRPDTPTRAVAPGTAGTVGTTTAPDPAPTALTLEALTDRG